VCVEKRDEEGGEVCMSCDYLDLEDVGIEGEGRGNDGRGGFMSVSQT